MSKKPFTYISLFSCAGVGCYGFKQAGFECVATNELSPRRLVIQKYNHKCSRDEGYICGDITLDSTKQQIFDEITWWKENRYVTEIDVVIATPPCQGMSIFLSKERLRLGANAGFDLKLTRVMISLLEKSTQALST